MPRTPDRPARSVDVRECLDYYYQSQVEVLARLGRAAADAATSRMRLGLQVNYLEKQRDRIKTTLDGVNPEKLEIVKDMTAQLAAANLDLQNLERQYTQVVESEEEATLEYRARDRLRNSFRANKEAFKAQYLNARSVGNSQDLSIRKKTTDDIDDSQAVQLGSLMDLLSLDALGANEPPSQ